MEDGTGDELLLPVFLQGPVGNYSTATCTRELGVQSVKNFQREVRIVRVEFHSNTCIISMHTLPDHG